MRIAWFTHRYHPCIGGAETYGREMVRRFVAAGHGVDVFTSDADDLHYFTDRRRRRVTAPAESVVDGANVYRFPVWHVPGQRAFGRLLSYLPHWPTQCRWESFMPIIPAIEHVRGPYELVFAVGFPFTIFSYGAYRTARAARAPLILTPFLHLSEPGDRVHRTYTRPHQVRLLRAADLVVSPTHREASVVRSWGIPADRSLVLPMACDAQAVTGGNRPRFRERLGIAPDQPVVGQLGALDPDKGTTDLVHAVARLNESRPGTAPIALVLAGRATPRFETFLHSRHINGRHWLHVIGSLSTNEVADFYAGIDIFAMPSRTDSFGIVFLEAWANARPVVAAAAGGVPEVVQDGVTGRLVPFGAVEQLGTVLAELIADRAQAARLGDAGRQLVTNGYTWDDRFATLFARASRL